MWRLGFFKMRIVIIILLSVLFFSCEQRDGKSNLGIDTTKDSLRITNEIEIKKSERFSDTLYFNIENDSHNLPSAASRCFP